jgi:isopenicillin-N epimerase
VSLREHWRLEPDLAFLNHGSFGACPVPVLEAQAALRNRLEAEPVRFLDRELESRLDEARLGVGSFLGADPDGLAFLPNATTGVATVLASLRLRPGDEIVATDHEYNATLNAARRTAEAAGGRLVIVRIPFPISGPDEALDAILEAVSERTRLVLVSHVTSPTAIVLPVDRMAAELAARGIDTLVDGAHAPGMVPLEVDHLGAAWYVANGHKWLCGPKGTAILWARADRRAGLHPLVTSHGANDERTDRSRFRLEFDWLGTTDPTPHLVLPAAIEWMDAVVSGGWRAIEASNRAGALAARDRLAELLGIDPPVPDAMLGSMAAVPLPIDPRDEAAADALQVALAEDDRVEVPIGPWPVRAARTSGEPPQAILLRVSWQIYNEPWELERLVDALRRRLPAVGGRAPARG